MKQQQQQQPPQQQQPVVRGNTGSIENTNWQSNDNSSSVWQSAEDYPDAYSYPPPEPVPAPAPSSTPHRKRTLPQIRPPSRSKAAAVSLPQTPVRQLPSHSGPVSMRTSAPVSRTTSADYDFSSEAYNENYNYAYVSNDNLPSEKMGYDARTAMSEFDYIAQQGFGAPVYQQNASEYQPVQPSYQPAYQPSDAFPQTDNYLTQEQYPNAGTYQPAEAYQAPAYQTQNAYPTQEAYQSSDVYKPVEQYQSTDIYQSTENYPLVDQYADTQNYQSNENYQNQRNAQGYQEQTNDYYYSGETFYDAESKTTTQKKYLGRRAPSPFAQQNTDSLESRDDELRDESFETAVDSICSSVPQKIPEPIPVAVPPPVTAQVEHAEKPKPAETGLFSGFLGQSNKQQNQTQNQQKEQPTILSNPALAAMNVTKGFFSSITSAVNNTVQNINKQQKPQQPPENQVQRIQVTKRGSLKQQESLGSNRQKSFDDFIPEEEEYRQEEEYRDPRQDYYQEEFSETDYSRSEYRQEKRLSDSYPEGIKEEEEYYEQWEPPRRGSLQHQETIDGYLPPRGPLRAQESVDECAEEVAAMTTRRVSLEPYSEPHDNSLIEPYHPDPESYPPPADIYGPDGYASEKRHSQVEPYRPSAVEPYYPSKKAVSPSPPAIQKQQSIDLDGNTFPPLVTSPPAVAITSPNEIPSLPFEDGQTSMPVHTAVQPERRKMTAKARWHRAYNMIVQNLNVSRLFL